jgi:hypothetical protein
MTRAQFAAVFLAGAGAGAVPGVIAKALTSSAEAAVVKPLAHAVDLRRDFQSAGEPRVAVYGNLKRAPDAGVVDIGAAQRCLPDAPTAKDCTQCMNGLAKNCVWP